MGEKNLAIYFVVFCFVDIYIYLNNTLVEHEKAEKAEQHEKTRQELIRKCKHIRNLFENEFNPFSDDFVDASYLAMDGNCSTKHEEQGRLRMKRQGLKIFSLEMFNKVHGQAIILNQCMLPQTKLIIYACF